MVIIPSQSGSLQVFYILAQFFCWMLPYNMTVHVFCLPLDNAQRELFLGVS